jgi:uncharacterized repeat protein (TIGR03803 family)
MKPIRAPSMATHTLHPHFAAFLLIVLALGLISAMLDAQTGKLPSASTETVLYHFTGGIDGGTPYAGLVFDQAGNLYGTTTTGGAYARGTVYELTPSEGGWTQTVLYSFTGGQDGASPYGGVIFDPVGNLWGTTYQGGDPGCGCGTVFELSPSESGWIFNLVHAFTGVSDGAYPTAGLVYGAGSLFGTTKYGGLSKGLCEFFGCGTIFSVVSGSSYRVWTNFLPKTGFQPQAGLFFDPERNCLFGTTEWGSYAGLGTVFADCHPGYMRRLHAFSYRKAGSNPLAGVILDASGNAYGTTSSGDRNAGAVFKIVDAQNGGRRIKVLHQFSGTDGSEPLGDLVFDAAGNIYGTTCAGGGNRQGVVFKLTPPGIKQHKWTETVLYSFSGSDGAKPVSGLVFDDAGNLYGTTTAGGAYGAGVVFKMTP